MDFSLKVWRQSGPNAEGYFERYELKGVSSDASFIEMMNLLNEKIESQGGNPVQFDCDCLEGICGACSMTINGCPHGKEDKTTTCQTHMRTFRDGDEIVIEPFRASAFPVIKDLVVDRTALDRIIQAGGYVSVNTGGTPDANLIPIPKPEADRAMDAAECIGCGACVAACNNGSAMLFTSAKVSHLSSLPQGRVEKDRRVIAIVEQMDKEGFGNCTNHLECEAACPKGISTEFIAQMNRDYIAANIKKVFE